MRMNAHRRVMWTGLLTLTASCAAGSPADTYYADIGIEAGAVSPPVDAGKKDATSSRDAGGGPGTNPGGSGADADGVQAMTTDDATDDMTAANDAPAGDDGSAGSDAGTVGPSSDAGGCASCNGCCDLGGACVSGVSDTSCGSGGGSCTDCTMIGGSCQPGGTCSANPVPDAGNDGGSTGQRDAGACSQRTCRNGCCDSNGVCQPGTTTTACGQNGQRCRDCTNAGIQHVCGKPIPICL